MWWWRLCGATLCMALSVGVLLTCAPRLAAAQAPTPGVTGPEPAALERAKKLFFQANALRNAGDCERAAELYLASRALVPSLPNTMNAAICLEQVSREDEALEMYEQLLAEYSAELGDEARRPVVAEMKRLRALLGGLVVVSNVPGARLLIDDRERGQLPHPRLRLRPGVRRLRVAKDGYSVFETMVRISVGATARVDAQLAPLLTSGKLRLEHPELEGATVYIDGGAVGKLPWVGRLLPGPHSYFVRLDDRGIGPRAIVIVAGQTALGDVEALALGPELHVAAEPATAELLVDRVPVARGSWRGRLPLGNHTIEARELGYRSARRPLRVHEAMEESLQLRLQADPAHDRWNGDSRIPIWLSLFAGPAVATTLASDAEASCAPLDCGQSAVALGFLGGLRVGYELAPPLSLELAGGYLTLSKRLLRHFVSTVTNPKTFNLTVLYYNMRDDVQLAGPFLSAGVGYRVPLNEWLAFHSHATVGALFASASDEISGHVSGRGRTLEAAVEGSGTPHDAVDLLVLPEVSLALRQGGLHAGLGLAVAFLLLDGPVYDEHGALVPIGGNCDGSDPVAVDCAPGKPFLRGERSYGPLVGFVPTVSVGYSF